MHAVCTHLILLHLKSANRHPSLIRSFKCFHKQSHKFHRTREGIYPM